MASCNTISLNFKTSAKGFDLLDYFFRKERKQVNISVSDTYVCIFYLCLREDAQEGPLKSFR